MPSPHADRNLLFGILALQNDFVSRDQLVEAMNAWVLARHRPLGDLLLQRGLSREEHDLLEALVNRQLARHHGDIEKSLHAIELSSSARSALAAVPDADVQASLASLDTPSFNATTDHARTTNSKATTDHVPRPGADGLRYRVLRPHARGGLGEVFVALDTELHREVALKEIQQEHADDPGSRGRFLLEAEITGRLEHPGIVPVYGLGHYADGRPFYAMRFIKGDNLKHAIDRFHASKQGFDTVEFRQVLRRFLDVCNAVAFAHNRGVLHRDLKPGNVMLGEFGETLLVDWGLAKVVGRTEPKVGEPTLQLPSGSNVVATVAGSAIGTPAYMSPEQAEGKLEALGPATDVYSLGATLYCLLTGRAPVPEGPIADVLEKVRRGGIPPATQVRAGVPKALAAVCAKAMALQPGERYPSALALAQDVERWLADEAVAAYPDPLLAQTGRWARKHRTLVATAAAALLVALAGLGVGLAVVGGLNRRLEGANAELTQANAKLDAALGEVEARQKETENERNIAVAVNDFLRKDLLGQADIANQPLLAGKAARDRNITVAELLDRSAKAVEGKFKGQPETEAAIRLTIGEAYLGLGKHDLARPHLEQSLALRVKKLGADHPLTLASRDKLALLHLSQGKFDLAEPLCLEILKQREKALGPDHPDTLSSQNNLVQVYQAQGKYNLAEPLCLEVLRRCEKIYGADHPHALGSKHSLALVYLNQGKFEQAVPVCLEVARVREKTLGADHPDTLTSRHNLASAYYRLRQFDKAEPIFAEVLRLREKRLGPEHPHALVSKNLLAGLYADLRKFEEAERLFQEALRLREKTLGADHPSTLTSKNNLAWLFQLQGKQEKAEPLYREVVQAREKALGPDHPGTLTSKNNLASVYRAQGRYAEAEPLALVSAAGALKNLGLAHPSTRLFLDELATLYERWGKPEKAEPPRRQVLDFVRSKDGPDSPAAAGAMANLGENLLRQKKPAEAEELLRESLRAREKAQPDLWTTFSTRSLLGEALVGQKKYGEAEPLLVAGWEGLAKREAKMPPDRAVQLQAALERLVWLYEATGNKGEAARWRQELDKATKAAEKTPAKK